MQHQHLEHQRDVVRLTPGVALALLVVDDRQQRAEGRPVHNAIQPRQRIAQLLQLRQPLFLVKEPCLHAIFPLSAYWLLFCPNRGIIRDALQINSLPNKKVRNNLDTIR